jgi:hypothetical protein
MKPFLGLDHPLVLARDLDVTASRYEALGFAPRPLGRHPWGTSMRVVQFDKCAIELMSIYDESLIDALAVDGFSFGRHIRDHLAEREGISLLALYSEDAEGDAAAVMSRGIRCNGTIEFGREVSLADGRAERTRTTLKILHDPGLERLSSFIVHQHRPDLIVRPEWLVHPNGALVIQQVTIMAGAEDRPRVRARLAGLYGEGEIFDRDGGFGARTGNGSYVVMTKDAVEAAYGRLPEALAGERRPSCVAIHVSVPDLDIMRSLIAKAGAPSTDDGEQIRLGEAAPYGNVFLAFAAAPRS